VASLPVRDPGRFVTASAVSRLRRHGVVRSGAQTRQQLPSSVETLMEDLGPTVDAMAEHLRALGVRGRPGDEEQCVLNSYLRFVVGADPTVVGVAVRPHAVHVRVHHWSPAVRVPLSVEARAFIAAFGARLHPGLVAETTELKRWQLSAKR
jgi:hypothetical protein